MIPAILSFAFVAAGWLTFVGAVVFLVSNPKEQP